MHIVADENIPYLQEYFSDFGQVTAVNGRNLTAAQLAAADVLLVRSVTPVNAALLTTTPVGFVGTCTIGTDHLDTDFLQQRAIAYASAPGCNAGGVVQYVLTALSQLRGDWLTQRVGIVGCGNVGRRLYQTLERLGVDCMAYDPFVQNTEVRLVPFAEVLNADIICVHAPLTHAGPFPTHHMFDADVLSRLKPGALLLNAGRGGVIDNQALLHHLSRGAELEVVLDVWEHEPAINPALARQVRIATPHIAGYSDEGRTNGTIMICRALAEYLGWPAERIAQHVQTVATRIGVAGGELEAESLHGALLGAYDIWADHQRLLVAVKGEAALGPAFDALRKHYPERHEPSFFQVRLRAGDALLERQLVAAGFHVQVAHEQP